MTVQSWRLWFAAALVVQCAALYWPSSPSVDTGLPLDKIVHILLFATVASLGVMAGVPIGWLVGGLVLQSVVSEFVQGTMPGRSADVLDVLSDLLGIGLGVALGRWRTG